MKQHEHPHPVRSANESRVRSGSANPHGSVSGARTRKDAAKDAVFLREKEEEEEEKRLPGTGQAAQDPTAPITREGRAEMRNGASWLVAAPPTHHHTAGEGEQEESAGTRDRTPTATNCSPALMAGAKSGIDRERERERERERDESGFVRGRGRGSGGERWWSRGGKTENFRRGLAPKRARRWVMAG
jgi:hypothetical protein